MLWPETVKQHIGFGGQIRHCLRLALDIEVDDALPQCNRSMFSAGIINPPGRRTRTTSAPDAAEFDDLHPRQVIRIRHGGNVTRG